MLTSILHLGVYRFKILFSKNNFLCFRTDSLISVASTARNVKRFGFPSFFKLNCLSWWKITKCRRDCSILKYFNDKSENRVSLI